MKKVYLVSRTVLLMLVVVLFSSVFERHRNSKDAEIGGPQ